MNADTKKNKKNVKWIRFFLTTAIIIALGYVILNYIPFFAKYDTYVIKTGSMDPVIKKYDVVIIDTSVNHLDLNEGDIVGFYANINDDEVDEVVVHYIDSIIEFDGIYTYRTISEIGTLDEWILTDEDIVGVHVLTIPKVGRFLLFAQSTIGKIVLVVDIVVIYILIEYIAKPKKKKEDNIETVIVEKEDL